MKILFIEFVSALVSVIVDGSYKGKSKGCDNGLGGDYFEAKIKLFLNNVRGVLVSKMGRIDTRKAGFKIAIKSGYGCLYHIDEEGNPTSREYIGSDITVWAGDPLTPPEEALVIKTADILNSEIIREVFGTHMYQRHYNPEAERGSKIDGAFKNQVNLSSNKAKVDLEMNRLAVMTLAEFKELYCTK